MQSKNKKYRKKIKIIQKIFCFFTRNGYISVSYKYKLTEKE